jgi:hypothetical protein
VGIKEMFAAGGDNHPQHARRDAVVLGDGA